MGQGDICESVLELTFCLPHNPTPPKNCMLCTVVKMFLLIALSKLYVIDLTM